MPDLVLSTATLAPVDFGERVAAAAAGGYVGVGLSVAEYRRLLATGWTDRRMRATLAEHGQRVVEVEVLYGFDVDPGPADVAARPGLAYGDPDAERTAWHLCDTFGADVVLAVGAFTAPPPDPRAVERFGALCDRAAGHDTRVALEFVPYTDVPDVATATRIVAEAGRRNGGLCVDSWHFFRGNQSFVDLARAGPVFIVQIDDGPTAPTDPDLMTDAVHHRRIPGDGHFDLTAFLTTLWAAGVDTPLSVEVISDALHALGPAEAARRAAIGATAVVATALTASI